MRTEWAAPRLHLLARHKVVGIGGGAAALDHHDPANLIGVGGLIPLDHHNPASVFQMVDPEDVPDSAWVCSGGIMGSVRRLRDESGEAGEITLDSRDLPLSRSTTFWQQVRAIVSGS